MKTILVFTFFSLCLSTLSAQDILVLKKDESEVKCHIITVDNSVITYQLWKSDDKSTHSIKRVDVLSYLLENKSGSPLSPGSLIPGISDVKVNVNGRQKTMSRKEARTGGGFINEKKELLARYFSGETVNGYIINNYGDTIKGILTIQNIAMNQIAVLFRDEQGISHRYSTGDLRGYGYRQLEYESVETRFIREITTGHRSESGQLFLHREVDGPAKLYRFYTLKFKKSLILNNPNPPYYLGKLKSHYLMKNPAGKQILTKGRTIRGTLNRLYTDNKGLMDKVRMKNPKHEDVPGLIRSYNAWHESRRQ